jgi:hypothetical protein
MLWRWKNIYLFIDKQRNIYYLLFFDNEKGLSPRKNIYFVDVQQQYDIDI